MRMRDIMSAPVRTIDPDSPADDAWQRMRMYRIRHLVVEDHGRLTGVISDRDLGGEQGELLRAGRRVADCMTSHVTTVTPDTTVREAANLLRGHTISCLPVVHRGSVVGIATVSDLLELIGRGAERPLPQSRRWVMRDRGPRRKTGGGAPARGISLAKSG